MSEAVGTQNKRESPSMSITSLFASGNLPNLVFLITDQERSLQHYPSTFLSQLPAMQQLMNNGITFQQAYTAACMCSPSRATFLTSNYPAVTKVTTTGSPEPSTALPPASVFPNLATVLQQAGYAAQNIAWRGKWHLGNTPNDYGFSGWTPPDAGNYLGPSIQSMKSLGGGTADNDGSRFLPEALAFLSDPARQTAPFALVVSFVNPHDVYVGQIGLSGSGYLSTTFTDVPVLLPTDVDENLATKPRAQANMSWSNLQPSTTQQDYVNFYAYLQTLVDGQILKILSQLTASNLMNNTLIVRFADHGEQALSHGLVEKFYNAYAETTNVPLIFSNPIVWPSAQTTYSLASTLDLVPTIASLLGVAGDFNGFRGQDLTPLLENPTATVQSTLHFTYDDVETSRGPSVVRNIRTVGYSYSVYFTDDGTDADWELYDLGADPLEDNNVAGTAQYGVIQQQLDNELQALMAANGTAPSFAWPPQQTADSVGGPPAIGTAATSVALADEVSTLVASGSASVDRLSQILYGSDTPSHIVVRAARGLAKLGTPEAFAALQPALYGPWPRKVAAQVHAALASRPKRAG